MFRGSPVRASIVPIIATPARDLVAVRHGEFQARRGAAVTRVDRRWTRNGRRRSRLGAVSAATVESLGSRLMTAPVPECEEAI